MSRPLSAHLDRVRQDCPTLTEYPLCTDTRQSCYEPSHRAKTHCLSSISPACIVAWGLLPCVQESPVTSYHTAACLVTALFPGGVWVWAWHPDSSQPFGGWSITPSPFWDNSRSAPAAPMGVGQQPPPPLPVQALRGGLFPRADLSLPGALTAPLGSPCFPRCCFTPSRGHTRIFPEDVHLSPKAQAQLFLGVAGFSTAVHWVLVCVQGWQPWSQGRSKNDTQQDPVESLSWPGQP